MGKNNNGPASLKYGAHFNYALCRRLANHFANEQTDPEGDGKRALVVGLFGEWGSGKTLHLRHIEHHFHTKLEELGDIKKKDQVTQITLPVFFNAWRYEAEEHLIIPLLKTTQHQILRWQKANTKGTTRAWTWLKKRAQAAADSAIALSYGFKGKFGIPNLVEVEVEPGKMVDEDNKRQRQREQAQRSSIDALGSVLRL